jgi:hypothetical protein
MKIETVLTHKVLSSFNLSQEQRDQIVVIYETCGNVDLRSLPDFLTYTDHDLSLSERYIRARQIGCKVTLEKFQLRYGMTFGNKRWDAYKERQAYTNSLEYKSKKHGFTQDEFDLYNKNRAVTKVNLIKKYGEELGNKKWYAYKERQAYTNSLEYNIETLGVSKGTANYNRICSEKALNYKNAMRLHDNDESLALTWLDSVNKHRGNYFGRSKIADELFSLVATKFASCKQYYGDNEFGLYCKSLRKYTKFDYVNLDAKLCIEYHGDHYHGNPKLYKPNDLLKGRGCNKIMAKDKWVEDDLKQQNMFSQKGFDVIIIWDSDYRKDRDAVLNNIMSMLNDRLHSRI